MIGHNRLLVSESVGITVPSSCDQIWLENIELHDDQRRWSSSDYVEGGEWPSDRKFNKACERGASELSWRGGMARSNIESSAGGRE